jgi:hypothetical protein
MFLLKILAHIWLPFVGILQLWMLVLSVMLQFILKILTSLYSSTVLLMFTLVLFTAMLTDTLHTCCERTSCTLHVLQCLTFGFFRKKLSKIWKTDHHGKFLQAKHFHWVYHKLTMGSILLFFHSMQLPSHYVWSFLKGKFRYPFCMSV